jgi:predicted alpha/beta-fold hydrolase
VINILPGSFTFQQLHLCTFSHNISIPLCVVHAFDDPLVTWRTVAANGGLMHPTNLTRTGSGNLFILLTKRGGHVGWPLGWVPFVSNWKWMNDAAMSFVEAVGRTTAKP